MMKSLVRPVAVADRTTATTKIESQVKQGLTEQLQALLDTAYECGFVITVDLVPDAPLAMGNYHMVGHVRPAR